MTVKEVVRNFLECTSLNSVPFVITAPNSCIKFLWVSIIVAGTGAMLFHLSYVVFTYLEYGTTTGITFKNSNLIFPDVLICNKNAVRKSKIPDLQSEPYKAFLKQFTNVNNSKPGKPIQNTLNITNPFKKTKTSWQQNVNTQMKLYYTSEPRDIRKEVSHQIDDMLLNCEFNGEKCSSKDFRLINTADYGNCYFFNPHERIINTPGAENGLHVQFFLQGNEFIPYLSQFGLQVLISVPHSIMFPNDLGIYASSNFETRISVRQNNITRMSGSYGTCNSSDAKLGKNKQIYTLYACTVLCEIEYAEKICHCVAPEDSDYAILLKSPMKIKYCNIEKTRCVEETKESTRNGSNPICSNRCYNPCNETTYSLTLSTQIWPDVHTVDNLVNFICQSNTTGCRYLNNLDYLQKRDNFAALTVFYDKMQYTYYEETASYGAVSFASDFGGTMGLWIGISALTLVEIIYFLCCLVAAMICSIGKRPKTTAVELDSYK